jgi:ABC-type enterochelin transport system ATPase subunit
VSIDENGAGKTSLFSIMILLVALETIEIAQAMPQNICKFLKNAA